MSDMQAIILQSAEKILSKHTEKEIIDDAEKGHFPADLWKGLQESGLLLMGVREEQGGHGGDCTDGFRLIQLAGKYSAPIPLAETLISNWVLAELGMEANDAVKSLSCLFEPGKNGLTFDGICVSGKIPSVPYGRHAEYVIAFLKVDQEIELLKIPVSLTMIEKTANLAGEPRDTLYINQLALHQLEHMSIPNAVYERAAFLGAAARVAQMTGAMERIMELVIEHVETRYQFGRPLSRQQAIQHHIASLAGELAAAKTALQNAVSSVHDTRFAPEIALAKIRLNEGAGQFAKIAHQILAAIGFTHEHSLHYSTRRLWSYRDEFGTEADWSNTFAHHLQKWGANGIWNYLTQQREGKGEEHERFTIYRYE